MKHTRTLVFTGLVPLIFWLTACASGPAPDSATAAYEAATSRDPAARQAAPAEAPGGKKPVWSVPSEEEVAAALDQKYLAV